MHSWLKHWHAKLHLAAILFLLQPFSVALASGVEEAGRIIVPGANSYAVDTAGTKRDLKSNSPVYRGDTITTQEYPLQIQFTDGGLTTLRPYTKFLIESYQWQGRADGKEKGFFELLKGGLRTVTGAIGKKYRNNYRMKTPAATIGIRGTDYSIRYCEDDCPATEKGAESTNGLIGTVNSGQIEVSNEGGSRTFSRNHFFNVANRMFRPNRLKRSLSRLLNIKGKFRSVPLRSLTRQWSRSLNNKLHRNIRRLNTRKLLPY